MDFEFDCPKKIDLSAVNADHFTFTTGDSNWFFVDHDAHERSEVDSSQSREERAPFDNEEYISDVNAHDSRMESRAKTTVPMMSFVKKRPLSKMGPSVLTSKKELRTSEKENAGINRSYIVKAISKPTVSKKTKPEARLPAAAPVKAGAVQKPKPSRTHTCSVAATQKDQCNDQQEMLDMLKKHNEKFAPVSLYEPPRHSVRDIRKWERHSGQVWSSLKPDERGVVNEQISDMKKNKSGPFCV
jgi:hypothetical protein